MLEIIKSWKELDFSALMDVYYESNQENAQEFGKERVQIENDFSDYLRNDFFRTPMAFYAVWKENGVPVSALRMEPYRDGWLLEALETTPGMRRRGMAEKLIRSVMANVDSKPVYSHVSKRNEPSLRTHVACGFEKVLDYAVYLDGSVNQRAVTLCCRRNKSSNG